MARKVAAGKKGRKPAAARKAAAPARSASGREARSAERREVILNAALDEFAERGFESARP